MSHSITSFASETYPEKAARNVIPSHRELCRRQIEEIVYGVHSCVGAMRKNVRRHAACSARVLFHMRKATASVLSLPHVYIDMYVIDAVI